MDKINNYSEKFPQLVNGSPEWALIQYKLQLSTGTTTAVVKKIQNLANPTLVAQFEKANKGALQIDSFMLKEQLDEGTNRFQKVTEKGFDFPKSGLRFVVGFLKMNAQPGKTHEIIMYKIGVGKSYCMPSKSYSKDKIIKPEGFDSIYLYNQNESNEYFKHQYILFQTEQVLPCYLIQMQFDTTKQLSLRPPQCQNCGINNSKWYCITQDISLCAQCDLDYHKNKMAGRHQRVDINDKPKGYGNCKDHGAVKLQLFCTDCSMPICINCKINGNHSSGQYGKHNITRIAEAYQKAITSSKQADPSLDKRKHQISQLLAGIDMKIKEINRKASQTQQEIYQLLNNALRDLRQITQKKMSYLIGDQLQLKRQYDQIQWMQSFLKYQHQHLTPSDFLSNWARHAKLRKEVLNLSNIPVVTDVRTDMSVHGKIQVKSESMNISSGAVQSRNIENQKLQTATQFRRKLFNKNTIQKNNDIDKNNMLVANSALTGGVMAGDQQRTMKKGDQRSFREGILESQK